MTILKQVHVLERYDIHWERIADRPLWSIQYVWYVERLAKNKTFVFKLHNSYVKYCKTLMKFICSICGKDVMRTLPESFKNYLIRDSEVPFVNP